MEVVLKNKNRQETELQQNTYESREGKKSTKRD